MWTDRRVVVEELSSRLWHTDNLVTTNKQIILAGFTFKDPYTFFTTRLHKCPEHLNIFTVYISSNTNFKLLDKYPDSN